MNDLHEPVPVPRSREIDGRTVTFKVCATCGYQVAPKKNNSGWMHYNHGRGVSPRYSRSKFDLR